MALTNKLSAIGDAIRSKTGGTELLTLDQMPTAIASIETGSNETYFEIIDFVQDNTTSNGKNIYPQDMSYDNYMVQYAVVQTGTYTDGVLTMDDTPTLPTGKNIPLIGLCSYLSKTIDFSGKYGSTTASNYKMCSAYGVVRGSFSTYGTTSACARGTTYLTVKSQYSFGSTGKYIKYRCYVFGWNNPPEEE